MKLATTETYIDTEQEQKDGDSLEQEFKTDVKEAPMPELNDFSDTEDSEEISTKQIDQINRTVVESLVEVADNSLAFAASIYARAENDKKYHAPKESRKNIAELIRQLMPKAKVGIPLGVALIIAILAAYVPIFKIAYDDRRANEIIQAQKVENEKLQQEIEQLKNQNGTKQQNT